MNKDTNFKLRNIYLRDKPLWRNDKDLVAFIVVLTYAQISSVNLY